MSVWPPPSRTSAPASPVRSSAPPWPVIVSLPSPPASVSAPTPPPIVSVPSSPRTSSSRRPPVKLSLPDPRLPAKRGEIRLSPVTLAWPPQPKSGRTMSLPPPIRSTTGTPGPGSQPTLEPPTASSLASSSDWVIWMIVRVPLLQTTSLATTFVVQPGVLLRIAGSPKPIWRTRNPARDPSAKCSTITRQPLSPSGWSTAPTSAPTPTETSAPAGAAAASAPVRISASSARRTARPSHGPKAGSTEACPPGASGH